MLKIVRTILIALIVIILGGLAGWYFYISSKGSAITAMDNGRGIGESNPRFGGVSRSSGLSQSNTQTSRTEGGTSGSVSGPLWKVDATPVAGMGFVATNTQEYLYYVERANGYVFESFPPTQVIKRLTDTLLPKIYEAYIAHEGSVVLRSIDDRGRITTFLGTISASSSPILTNLTGTASASNSNTIRARIAQNTASNIQGQNVPNILTGVYIEPNIQSLALNPTSRSFFYLIPNTQGGVNGFIQEWNGTKRKQIFSSSIRSWNSVVLEDGRIVLTESPADGIAGYAYVLGKTGVLTPLVRNIQGLEVAQKSTSQTLLYSESSVDTVTLFSRATSTPRQLPLATVAEKCVWLPGNSLIAYCAVPRQQLSTSFLDNWFRGVVHTSDDWWKIDLSSDTVERVSMGTNQSALDVVHPTIDSSGTYIAFINAVDQSLWVLRVAQ